MDEYLDLDSKSAVTLFSYIEIIRENPLEELGMVDLENHVSEAIWKLFDSSREEAAERLGINEVDLILTDARVMGVKIDDNEVINPEGFTGRKLEVLLSLTMVRRDKFVESKFLCEGGAVRAFLLANNAKLKHGLYVETHDDHSTVFQIDPRSITYLTEFDWGGKSVFSAIEEELGLSSDAARDAYERYAFGHTSPHVTRKFDRMFYDAFDNFVDGFVTSVKSSRPRGKDLPPVYFKSFFPVSEKLHSKRFPIGSKRFTLQPTETNTDIDTFMREATSDTYKELNTLAQRRIKWLMPTT